MVPWLALCSGGCCTSTAELRWAAHVDIYNVIFVQCDFCMTCFLYNVLLYNVILYNLLLYNVLFVQCAFLSQ